MNLIKYVGQQFGKPTGIGGKLSTFVMNRMSQKQYNTVYFWSDLDKGLAEISRVLKSSCISYMKKSIKHSPLN